jgi:hypothetical protein
MVVPLALLRETTMKRLVHNLALSALLLHMLGGCCLHHAHAECHGECGESEPEPACCECEAHHRGDHVSHDAGPVPQHQHGCQVGMCDFVVPAAGNTNLPRGDSTAAFLSVNLGSHGGASAAPTSRNDGFLDDLAPPCRVHLMKQVLLL